MKPSYITSTLSTAFMLCMATVLYMLMKGIEPNRELLSIVSGVIGAYIGARIPKHQEEPKESNFTTRKI